MTLDTTFAVGTPFAPRTVELNRYATWLQWFGYLVADVYTSYEDELDAIRHRVAMNEMSPLRKYRIRGPEAARFMNLLVTRDLSDLAVGQVCYTPWCDDDGNLVCDGLVFRLGENDFRISGGHLTQWLAERTEGFDVAVTDETEQLAILALQGPRSAGGSRVRHGESWHELGFSRRRAAKIGGVEVDVSRQGFTGELGYELWVRAEDAVALWDAIASAGEPVGIQPAGEWAIDVARIEAGLLIAGYDYDMAGPDPGQDGLQTTPEHQGTRSNSEWERFVDFGKPEFFGRQALLDRREAGRLLTGLEIDWRAIVAAYDEQALAPPAADAACVLVSARGEAGRSCGRPSVSVTWSPTLGRMIGFGHLPRQLVAAGTEVSVVWLDQAVGVVEATAKGVVNLPFRLCVEPTGLADGKVPWTRRLVS